MAKDPKTGRQIADVARERKAALTTPKTRTREQASNDDLAQIKNRKEAEALPEGNVRRRRY